MPLFLLPNLLGEVDNPHNFLPSSVKEAVLQLDGLMAESEKGGRSYLRLFIEKPQIPILLLNEHSQESDLRELLKPVLAGQTWGIVSDGGLPCIADPGSNLVLLAHHHHIEVKAWMGPSSIMLALMLSGLSGQRFSFQGYLKREQSERKQEIKQLEKRSKDRAETQIFIEAPYRNIATLQNCIETLDDKTYLCVAWDLTLPTEGVITTTIKEWKKQELPPLHKHPTLFLVGIIR